MTLAASLLAILLASSVAYAEPVVTIRNNGADENRLNIVILGDGYTEGELLKYTRDVDNLVIGMFAQRPYADYAAYFNVHRVDVVSNESGADHPEREVARDTALGARYNCNDVVRLVCVDLTAVSEVLSRSLPGSTSRDLVIVVVNDPQYGGSGGRYTVGSTHPLSLEILLHEAGHTLGLLADEYATGGTCNAVSEPGAVNVTKETSRETLKWAYWVDPATQVPTTTQAPAIPGLYLGAVYCDEGVYRPTFDSKMRTLSRPFEQINTEQLIKRFYNFVSPIDAVIPSFADLTIRQGQSLGFAVQRPQPTGRDLLVSWSIDGMAVGNDAGLSIDTATTAPGRYRVEVTVYDNTPLVLRDQREALVERFRWNLTIIP
jgi:IgA peptidase M64